MFDNFNVNLRKSEGFLTSIPTIPIPEYGQLNARYVYSDLTPVVNSLMRPVTIDAKTSFSVLNFDENSETLSL